MQLQQVQTVVDRLGQAQLADQEHHRAQAVVAHAARPFGQLEVDVRGREDRPRDVAQLRLVEPPFDAPLAGRQLPSYLGLHSKSLRGACVDGLQLPSIPRKTPKDFEFFCGPLPPRPSGYAWLGAS
jgi:hypothetical protein